MNAHRPRILWGITGSVAAIRSKNLLGELTKVGEVQAVITRRSRHFLELPFEVPIHDDDSEWQMWTKIGDPVLHIELRRWADCFVIAPATADALAKLAHGICDSLLLSVARAWDMSKPLLVAPAMNTLMWEHPVTAEHLERLTKWGVEVIPPVEKELACADVGMGAQADAKTIRREVESALSRMRP